MRLPYRKYYVTPSPHFPDGVLFRPEVPLRVIGPQGSEILLALVDTGADTTLLPRSTVEVIGGTIDDSQVSKVIGIGGRGLEVTSGEVTLALESDRQVFTWTARVQFISDEKFAEAGAILGHAGCLRFFRASFDGFDQEVELVPTSGFPGSIV